MKKVLRTSLNILHAMVVIVLGLVIILLFVLQSPRVQNKLVPFAEQRISEALNAQIKVGSVDISLPARLVLSKVHMADSTGEEFASADAIKLSLLDVNLWSLIRHGIDDAHFRLSSLWLVNPEFHLYRRESDCELNIGFLFRSSKPKSPARPSHLRVEIRSIYLKGGRFRYEDYSRRSPAYPPTPGKMDFSYLDLTALSGDFSFSYHDFDQEIEADIKSLTGREVRSGFELESLAMNFHMLPGKGLFPDIRIHGFDLKAAGSHLALDATVAGVTNRVADTIGHVPPASLCLHNSILDFGLLNYFLPKDLPLQGRVLLRGDFDGTVDSLFSPDMRVRFGQRSDLRTTAMLEHLLDPGRLTWTLGFSPSRIDFAELDTVLLAHLPLRDTVLFTGTIKGDMDKIKSRDLEIWIGHESHLLADVRLDDYVSPSNMIMNIKLKPSLISLREIKRVITSLKMPQELDQFSVVRAEGDYLGGIYDFVINAGVVSSAGNLNANLHMQLPPKVDLLTYEGWLTTHDLNFDKLHLTKGFQSTHLNFDGRVKGRGQTMKELDLILTGVATSSDYFGYELAKLTIDSVRVVNEVIGGGIQIVDPHGNADLSLLLNRSKSPNLIEVRGAFKDMDLKHYADFEDSLYISSFINLKLAGDSLDNYTGRAKFFDIGLNNLSKHKELKLHDLIIRSDRNTPVYKEVTLTSSVLELEMDGNFSFGSGGKLLKRLTREAQLYVRNVDSTIQAYYNSKVQDSVRTQINYTVSTQKEMNSLFDFFGVPCYVKAGSTLTGEFDSFRADSVEFMFASDSAAFAGTGFREILFSFTAAKPGKSNVISAIGNMSVAEVTVTPELKFQDIEFEPTFYHNKIQYWLTGHQTVHDNHFRISAETTFLTNWLVTRVNPKVSYLRLQDNEWTFGSMNQITTEGGKVTVEDLELNNGEQTIRINGVASSSFDDTLVVDISALSIPKVMKLFQNDSLIGGTVTLAKAKIAGTFGKPRMLAKGVIDNFSYQGIGGLKIVAETYMMTGGASPFIGGNTTWSFSGHRIMKLSGHYKLKTEELNFISDSANVPMKWLSMFASPHITHLGGTVQVDRLSIRGKIDDVRLKGIAHFDSARATVDYFKQPFFIDDADSLLFDEDKITFNDITIYSDSVGGGEALVNGTILYGGQKDVKINLKMTGVRDLHVMNTTVEDNELFYGNVVIGSGTADITGTINDINIRADMVTGPRCTLSIPIADYTSASRLDFVHFSGGIDTVPVRHKVDLKGYHLDLRVDVQPDALARIIFDEQVGDVIEAYGEGNLRMSINELGEFLMYGTYTITKGHYLFTAENIVNKNFILDRDGTISWNGDPYDAQLDMNAVYTVKPPISSLLGNSGSSARIPVDIVMHMKGSLAAPQIRLELQLSNMVEDDVAGVASYLRNIVFDEQELNRQVVSLLMFRRFAPATSSGPGDAGPGGAFTSSLSELIANQVNHWISQALNANVGVQINTSDLQTVELGIKATLFNDKVTVERNGSVLGRRTGGVSLGDISVTVKLLPVEKEDSNGVVQSDPYKGQMVMEIFNRENLGINYTNSNISGAGLFFKKDFDKIADLFRRRAVERARKDKDQIIE